MLTDEVKARPLWSDEECRAQAYDIELSLTARAAFYVVLLAMRDDYEAELERRKAQPLDSPDSVGWWAWDNGVCKGVSEVYEGFSGELIVGEEPGGLTPDYFSGRKWYRLHMPWEAPAPASPQATPATEQGATGE